MESLEKKLGHTFRSRQILEQALQHSSYANEHRSSGICSNERLEFLGDSVLGLVTADFLYRRYPDLPEGDMTRMRAALVCEGSLHEAACRLGLGQYLKLGRGEESGGGRERPSILADAMEAVIAATYLDGGIQSAAELIHRLLLDKREPEDRRRDNKTALQELVQRRANQILSYRLLDEQGPDHAKVFTAEVLVNGQSVGQGQGHSKKEAEQAAAAAALRRLSDG